MNSGGNNERAQHEEQEQQEEAAVAQLACQLVQLHHKHETYPASGGGAASTTLLRNNNKTSATFEATQNVFRPLIANLLLDITNEKFHTVNPANPRISATFETANGAQMLQLIGYKPIAAAAAGAASTSTTAATAAERWRFQGDLKSVQRAERVLSEYERLIAQEEQRARGGILPILHPSSSSSSATTATTTPKSRERQHQQQEQQASTKGDTNTSQYKAQLQERIRRDREELQARRDEKRQQSEVLRTDHLDAVENATLYATANATIHRHGRLRNSHYHARHFSIQRMHGSRHFACTCPGENIEAHWHLVEANLLYSFTVHLNADATAVLHQAPEFGFQYNSLPNTENFGKTLQVSVKTVSEDGRVSCVNSSKPVEECPMCDTPFGKLWV